MRLHALALATLLALPFAVSAQTAPAYDADLAKSLGADERGMRQYVLVILKTGPNKMADGEARKQMFQGHFANMGKLAADKKLVLAGPLDGKEGRRGIFVLNTPDIEAAKAWVATDPVIIHGEMVAEYHKFYGSAALMMVNEVHGKIEKK
ncbi:YciI family protein [Massilia sp. SYSU DXS3249]